MYILKNYFLLALCVVLFSGGCEEKNDDGLRAVIIEMKFDALQTTGDWNYAYMAVQLSSIDPETYFFHERERYQGEPKVTLESEKMIWPVGTNVLREVTIGGIRNGVDNVLPCDVEIRIKADNIIIWSTKLKRGDNAVFDDGNMIIR